MSTTDTPGPSMQPLQDQILDDLATAGQPEQVVDLVLAAVQGDAEFAAALGGTPPVRREGQAVQEAGGVYLTSIEVQGFRGIGKKAAVKIKPGPGLTLVVGRNGSGKSSFAEAAEVAITGTSSRWDAKTLVWKSGWRNLHHATTGIRTEVLAEGQSHPMTVSCRWQGDDVGAPLITVKQQGAADRALADLGWGAALSTFRPFLSYAELGDAVTGQPAQLHDAIYSILGLGDAEAAYIRLNDELKRLDAERRQARAAAKTLAELMEAVDDERARRAADLLAKAKPDIDTLTAIATGSSAQQDPRLGRWRQIASASFPTPEEALSAAAGLEAAATALQDARRGVDASSARLAQILEAAAAHIDEHGPGPCPVCGVTQLDGQWPARARDEAAAYRGAVQSIKDAERRLQDAETAVRQVVAAAAPPSLFVEDFPETAQMLGAWHEIPLKGTASVVASELLALAEAAAGAVLEARTRAAELLQEQEDRWQPLAVQLSGWLVPAAQVARQQGRLATVKRAQSWFKTELGILKTQRMAPFTAHSAQVWQQLRQESNVDLGDVALVGTGPRRKLQIDVTVDGVEGQALGVMSQGELHALGLALFIPRATADQSPFRFLVIDDPVQAMDPAKVDGLARVLEQVALTRQVIVFTHDDRLPEAIRRMQIPAVVWEVVRKPDSEVEIRKNSDPVQRYLDDARALAMAQEIAPEIRGPVIAGFLRSAIESEAIDKARRTKLARGEPRAVVEAAIESAENTNKILALALFGDTGRGGDVLPRLNQWGPKLATAYNDCRSGVHGDHFDAWRKEDLQQQITAVQALTQRIRNA